MKTALICLALNVYYEANTEPVKGKYAVAHVTMNRVKESGDSVCGVVYKPSQFSWTLKSQPAPYGRGWVDAKNIAREVLEGESKDPTCGSTFFHSTSVRPLWAKTLKKVRKIGLHIFYKPRNIAHKENIKDDARYLSIPGVRPRNASSSQESLHKVSFPKHSDQQNKDQVLHRDGGCWI